MQTTETLGIFSHAVLRSQLHQLLEANAGFFGQCVLLSAMRHVRAFGSRDPTAAATAPAPKLRPPQRSIFGETVGRIYARTTAGRGRADWFWGLAFFHTLNARQPYYGLAESKAQPGGPLRNGAEHDRSEAARSQRKEAAN